jgi:hypothetical protein
MKKRSQGDLGMAETIELLARAKVAGLKVKDVAAVLNISPQQVSTYRHVSMPLNNRRVLAAYLESLSRQSESGLLYPSQQTAAEHDNVERLSRLTGARGPLWKMYKELAQSILRMAEEGSGRVDQDKQTGESGSDGPVPERGRERGSERSGDAQVSGSLV